VGRDRRSSRLLSGGATDGSWRKVKDATVASSIFGAVVIPALDNLNAGGPLEPDRAAPLIGRFIFNGLIGR
jgi:hypothetical protein